MHQLLSDRLQLPVANADDTLIQIISHQNENVNYAIHIPGINNLVPGAGGSVSERLLKPVTAPRGTA